MKKLWCLLIVTCTYLLFIGCGEDEQYLFVDDLLTQNGITDVHSGRCYDNFWKNKSNIWYSGIRNGKEWFAVFDRESQLLINEWYGQKQAIKDGIVGSINTEPQQLENGEYIFWIDYIDDNYLQQIYLQTNQQVKYDVKMSQESHRYQPISLLKGKGWHIYVYSDLSNEPDEAIFDFSGKVLPIKDVTCSNIEDSLQVYTGFLQDNHLWIGVYDNECSPIQEGMSIEPFERNRKQYIGYGKFKEYTIEKIIPFEPSSPPFRNPLSMQWGYAFSPDYKCKTGTFSGDIILLSNKTVYCCQLERTFYDNPQFWYNASILIDNRWVISPEGEILYEGTFPMSHTNYYPTSYTAWLEIGRFGTESRFCIRSRESNQTTPIWQTNFSHQIMGDAETTFTLLRKKDKLWTFHCDILNYDGSKEQFDFTVNIETGELTYL